METFDVTGLPPKQPVLGWRLFWGAVIIFIGIIIYSYMAFPSVFLGRRPASTRTTLSLTTPLARPTPLMLDTPALMYHYIRTVENPQDDTLGVSLSVTLANFDDQMGYLASHGFTTIAPDDLWQALNQQKKLPSKPILITFDDGYADFYSAAWPILQKYNLKATAFVVTGFLGDDQGRYMTWDNIYDLDRSGLVTIGNHTEHHANVDVHPDANREINTSQQQLETFLAHPITTFAYPGGTFGQGSADLVNQAGFNLAFTTQEGRSHTLATRLVSPRVRISGGTTLARFIEKVEGSKGRLGR